MRSSVIAGLLTLVMTSATLWSLSDLLPGGDEPHYLVIAESLLRDGDLEVKNNYDRQDYAEYFPGALSPDFVRRGRNGEVFSIHAPGTSVLVLPAFALFGYPGAQATMILLASVAGALVWLAAWLAARDRRAAWFAWLAVIGTATFLIQGVTIFPDGPGMLGVAGVVVLLLALSRSDISVSWRSLVGASVLPAAMPWLHTRFAGVAIGLGGLVVWRLLTDAAREPGRRWARVAAFLAVPAVSAAGWFTFFLMLYGTSNPLAPYGDDPGTRLAYVPGGLAGLLFDEQFGLLAYSPVLIAALGAVIVARDDDRPQWAVLVVVGVYLAAVASYWMWYAGVLATPARFVAIGLPAMAAPLAVAWRRAGAAPRALWSTLLAVSLAITAVTLTGAEGTLAWNTRGTSAAWLQWLNGVADLSRAWPSFFWGLTPGRPATETRFVGHVALWGVVFGISAVAWLWWRRKRPAGAATLTLEAGWWLAASLTAAIGCGWWLNGATGVDPARSQLRWLRALLAGDRAYVIRPFALEPVKRADRAVRIRAARHDPRQGAGAGSAVLEDVPAGLYEVAVVDRRPKPGTLSFRIGRAHAPVRTFPLGGPERPRLLLALPGGAETLTIESDTPAGEGRTIDLTPLTLDPQVTGRAVISARYGQADVFFCDRGVFVEGDGFWVRGGETTEVVLAAQAGRRVIGLELTNGAIDNVVHLRRQAASYEMRMAGSESRIVSVPLSEAGTADVRISSTAGFRPASAGAGSKGDTRYLGVRVRVLDSPVSIAQSRAEP